VPSGFNGVKATDDDVETSVEVIVFVLDPAAVTAIQSMRLSSAVENATTQSTRAATSGGCVRSDVATRNSLVDEARSNFSLGFAHVARPEEELTIQVGDIDRVHVDHIDAAEALKEEKHEDGEFIFRKMGRSKLGLGRVTRKSKILEKLAAESSCANHKDLAVRIASIIFQCSQIILQLQECQARPR